MVKYSKTEKIENFKKLQSGKITQKAPKKHIRHTNFFMLITSTRKQNFKSLPQVRNVFLRCHKKGLIEPAQVE